MQYHILISRINPSLKIDLVRVCTIVDGQAKTLTSDEFNKLVTTPSFWFLDDFIKSSDISDSMYISHARISEFIQNFFDVFSIDVDFSLTVDFFDNNFVIIFDYGTEKETPKEK